jgi:hypothetical protein
MNGVALDFHAGESMPAASADQPKTDGAPDTP